MRKSIFIRTFAAIVGTMLAIQLVAWFVVTVFSENIYYSQKLNQAKIAADTLDRSLNDPEISYGEFLYNLEDLSIQTGGRILIFDGTNTLVFGSSRWEEGTSNYNNLIPKDVFLLEEGKSQVFEYKDNNGKTTQYLYCERYTNGFLSIISIPVEAINDTVAVIKTILTFTILIATIISTETAYVLARSIVAPLLQLDHIADQIGKLNFSVRYQGSRQDEIGHLGYTLNDLAEKLDANIKGLKDELEKEKNMDALRKQFIAQASHEMQTPIAIINSYMEALEDDIVEDEEERELYFQIIREETDKMSRLVKGMLDLSQIESGTFTIKKDYFDIYGLLETVAEKYHGLAEMQGVQFEYDEENFGKEFQVYGDDFRLEQVLTNFVSNALKHTKEDHRVILEAKEKGESIRISVWNEGEQINENDMPYLWESFYKAKTIAGEKGIGLGLSIAKNILQLHGYSYGVGNVDDGVEFWFEALKVNRMEREEPARKGEKKK